MASWSSGAVRTAKAGYLTVTIAHQPRDLASRYALCAAPPLTMDNATCDLFKHLHWDRPHDISAVINELEHLNTAGEFRGQIDLLRIAVGGHSAGSSGALSVAGALRDFSGTVLDMRDGRPVAFLALSPQGPGGEGFFDTDFKKARALVDVGRPPCAARHRRRRQRVPPVRRARELRWRFPLPSAHRLRAHAGETEYQLYVHNADTFHMLFELNTAECAAKHVDQGKCAEIARWLRSHGTRISGRPAATVSAGDSVAAETNIVETASGGVAEWLGK